MENTKLEGLLNAAEMTGFLSPAGEPIRIMIADAHPVVREGIATLLQKRDDMKVVGKVQDGGAAVEAFDTVAPDVVLFDVGFSATENLNAVSVILNTHPDAKIVVFTASEREEHIYQAMQAGARGYLLKTSTLKEIIACIHTVFSGQRWIPRAIGDVLVRRMAAPELTRRERDVLHAMAEGRSNRSIAESLRVSEGTVKVHVTHILEKLRVGGRTEALAEAASRGLVTLIPLDGNSSLKNADGMNGNATPVELQRKAA